MEIVGRFESSGTWGIGFGGRGLALPGIRRVMHRLQRGPCHGAWGSSVLRGYQQLVHSLCQSSGPHYCANLLVIGFN